jgi:hypothetical protein
MSRLDKLYIGELGLMVKNQSREYIFTRIRLFTIKVDGFKMKKMVKEDLFFQTENILDHGKIMLDTVKEN